MSKLSVSPSETDHREHFRSRAKSVEETMSAKKVFIGQREREREGGGEGERERERERERGGERGGREGEREIKSKNQGKE